MLSVITPTFNCASFIRDAYKSMQWQTNPYWEWIVVDDGSTDNTKKLVESFAKIDDRIRVYSRNRFPKGACTCRNIGVEKSKFDFISFLDADDVLAPFAIEQRLNQFLKNPEVDFIAFQAVIFKKQLDDTRILWNVENGQDDLERTILMNPVFGGGNTIWKKASFVKLGKWDERLLIYQDIELDTRAFAQDLKYLKRLDMPPDIFGRINIHSISRNKEKNTQKLRSKLVFCQTINKNIVDGGKKMRCHKQLRWLFMKFFLEFVHERNYSLAKEMRTYIHDNYIITRISDKLFLAIVLSLSFLKINIVPLIYFFTRTGRSKSSFNTKHYDGVIRNL